MFPKNYVVVTEITKFMIALHFTPSQFANIIISPLFILTH
jgi:hypothetical protein